MTSVAPASKACGLLDGAHEGDDGRSCFWTILSPNCCAFVTALLSLIGAIEGLAARNAAEIVPRDRRELVAQLRRINRALKASSRGTPLDFHDLDAQFHDLFVTCGAGPRIRMLYDAIKPQA